MLTIITADFTLMFVGGIMAGNAHRRRQKERPSAGHSADGCLMCTVRPSGQVRLWGKKMYKNHKRHHAPIVKKKEKK